MADSEATATESTELRASRMLLAILGDRVRVCIPPDPSTWRPEDDAGGGVDEMGVPCILSHKVLSEYAAMIALFL